MYHALLSVALLSPSAGSSLDDYDDLTDGAKRAIEQGDYDLAIARSSRAMKLDPDFPVAYITRSRAYCAKGDWEKAIEDASTALSCKCDSVNETAAYHARGAAYEGKRDYAKAIKEYERAVKSSPNEPSSNASLAWLLATCPDDKLRDGAKAFAHAKRARAADPNDPDHMDTIAAAYAECGDFKHALEYVQMAIDGFKKRDNEEALKYCQERLELYKKEKCYRLPK